MVASLPSRVMNYRVSSSSPTDELLTVGQIFSEVGNYASSILDRESKAIARKCSAKLNKVLSELRSRRTIQSVENLYEVSKKEVTEVSDLATLTIGELYDLYRNWPMRHKKREAEGREPFTFYYEGHIIQELQKRTALTKADQLKIDYCVATYHNELDNLSFVLSLPIQGKEEGMLNGQKNLAAQKIYPDDNRQYEADELTVLISLYKAYRDITERELLVEYVDIALDLLEKTDDARLCLGLLSELAELRRKEIIRIPEWVIGKLEAGIKKALRPKKVARERNPEGRLAGIEKTFEEKTTGRGKSEVLEKIGVGNEGDLAVALLTMNLINNDPALERKAQRIINRCYKAAFDESVDFSTRISALHTAVTCSDYVTRFSIRKVTRLWKEICDKVFSSGTLDLENFIPSSRQDASPASKQGYPLSPKQIFQLLEIAKECENNAVVPSAVIEDLHLLLDTLAQSGDILGKAYNRFILQKLGL